MGDGSISDMSGDSPKVSGGRIPTALTDRELEAFGPPDPRILVCGCGGSGNNTMNRITHIGVEGAITVAINTDKQHLDHTRAQQKLLVGRHITRGLGAGGDPITGRRCAEAGRDVIGRIVSGSDLVFVTAGLGGGTGTGIAPIVAEEAKRSGALVVAIVTTPFSVERRMRMQRALEGLDMLRKAADAVLVLDNNRLLHYVPNLPLDEAFSIMDQLIAEIVKGIVETITLPSLINLDFADVRAIMKGGGVTMMLYGESDQGAEEVVHESLNHPLLDIEIEGATGALIHVTGGPYMTLEQANQVCDLMTARLSPDANVIFGARQDPAFGDTIKVMSIITGVASERLDREMMSADMLGDALNISRRGKHKEGGSLQRFD
ncbi:MAG TPA: cell division protein FtsZ [Candidatus Thalassarchaeaceae archaeon]|nr:cell division protein FtsZ [Candidatus Thalassarchaeaceae archaeon]HJO42910.1 cell division protein FtsZ [Candidatus Thalassarchaeaceae archaeon]